MVQLQNADRLNTIIEFGKTDETDVDEDGAPIVQFKPVYRALAGKWSLSTSQMLQQEGLDKMHTCMFIVRHRSNYDGITQARSNTEIYDITDINQDPFNNYTAYDLITLKEVNKNG